MPRFAFTLVLALAVSTAISVARQAPSVGPYKVLRTVKAGGVGGFDYITADATTRRLYIPRTGTGARVSVFDLDSLEPAGEIPNANARGVAVDPKSGHGFCSSKPVVMWDTKTLATVRTIDVQGNPDGILFDPFNQRVWVFSHTAPNATVIDATDGSVVGALDLGGAPEQAVTDAKGHLWVDIEDKDTVAVVDAKTLTVTAHYALSGSGATPAGLALDARNRILFVYCRKPGVVVVMQADGGKVLTTLPAGAGVDGGVFNPATMEAISSHADGTMTFVKETSPTSFAVEQTLQTMAGAKTLTLDGKTNRLFTMSAEFGPLPTPPPPGSRGRGPMVPDSFTILVVGR